jgi:photosystem II stability/assembly factor-like uncharacterized protein
VSRIFFADEGNGWAFMRSLIPTRDGGTTWGGRSDLGNPFVGLAAAGGRAYALVGACGNAAGNCARPLKLYESRIGIDRWQEIEGLAFPWDDRGDVAARGREAYVMAPGVFYARTPNGQWQPRTPPCPESAHLAAVAELSLVAACLTSSQQAGWMTDVAVSSDGGWRWTRISEAHLKDWNRSLATTGTDIFLAMGPQGLHVSRDGGRTFSLALPGNVSRVTFGSQRVGAVVVGRELESPGRLILTRDGGRTWSEARLPSLDRLMPGS